MLISSAEVKILTPNWHRHFDVVTVLRLHQSVLSSALHFPGSSRHPIPWSLPHQPPVPRHRHLFHLFSPHYVWLFCVFSFLCFTQWLSVDVECYLCETPSSCLYVENKYVSLVIWIPPAHSVCTPVLLHHTPWHLHANVWKMLKIKIHIGRNLHKAEKQDNL